MYSVKKTPRIYEPVHCFKDVVDHFAGFGDKVAFRYYSDPKTISDMTFAELAALIRREAAGFRIRMAQRR